MQVNIATIVPIHNELESTKRFLISYYGSLDNSPVKGHSSLIIVDDGSTDGSFEWISEFHPDIKVLKGDGGLWWSGSVNMALKHLWNMPFTHFLLFNNDNILHIDYFKNLLNAVNTIGDNKIISSKVINIYPKEYIIYGGVTFDRKRSKYIVNKNSDESTVVNTAGGMGVLVPLNVIHKNGLFDEINFPQKSGDTDFYLRADRLGFKVHYNPHTVVYNDNRITGFSGNRSIRGMLAAYSFPKGYMNLGVDIKLFLRHGNAFWSFYRILKNNIIFLVVGIVRIGKLHTNKMIKRFSQG